jgi:hypothetical protein
MSDIVKITIIGAVIFAAYKYGKNQSVKNNISSTIEEPTLKTGSFSKEIERLQENINRVLGKDLIEVTGAYSKEFKEFINDLFKDTTVLIDPIKGEISEEKLKDINKVLSNMNELIK